MRQTKERIFHHVSIAVFCKPHDDRDAVLRGLDTISPVPTAELLAQDPEPDHERARTMHYRMRDIELMVEETETDDGTMTIFTLFFKRMQWVNAFARRLVGAMQEHERAEFLEEPKRLLDADGRLSVRLDKDLLMDEKMSLTHDGYCYQVKASVAAYPKSEERMLSVVRRMLELEQ